MMLGMGDESKRQGVVNLHNRENIIGKFDTNLVLNFGDVRYKPTPLRGGLAVAHGHPVRSSAVIRRNTDQLSSRQSF
jgi:hypothetical protein